MAVKLSLLELARVTEGSTVKQTLDKAQLTARHVESLGFERVWVAEHHNMGSICSAATSLVISYLASATRSIRIGAGGIMLPNHSPYVIAEHFGTLAHLYPDRIDLGLGRAPGTDGVALRAMRREANASDRFPQDVLELQTFLEPAEPQQKLIAVPGEGTRVPLYILGSSLFGASLAAELGLPYAFASHFAPDQLHSALELYRHRFKPSKTLEKPYVIVGLNVIAADTDEEAKKLATSQQMSFANIVRGNREPLKKPIDDIDRYWTPQEKEISSRMLKCSLVGSPQTIKQGLEDFVQSTRADELMLVTDTFEMEARHRSLSLTAQALGKEPGQ